MRHHFATIRCRITSLNQHAQQSSLFTSQCKICVSGLNILWWTAINSDVTLHVKMTSLTAEDRLLTKTLQTEKGQTVDSATWWFPAWPHWTRYYRLFVIHHRMLRSSTTNWNLNYLPEHMGNCAIVANMNFAIVPSWWFTRKRSRTQISTTVLQGRQTKHMNDEADINMKRENLPCRQDLQGRESHS